MSQAQGVRFMPVGAVQQSQGAINMSQLGGLSQSQVSQSLTGGQQQNTVPIPQSIQGQPLTSATIQKLLDENAQFIQAICDCQTKGRAADASSLQKLLHTNLVYLATLADNCVASQTGSPQSGGQQTASSQQGAQMTVGSQMHVSGGSQMQVGVGLSTQMQLSAAQSQMVGNAQQQAIMTQQHALSAQPAVGGGQPQLVAGGGGASQQYVGENVQAQQQQTVYYAAQPQTITIPQQQAGAGGMYIPAQAVAVYRSADGSGNMPQPVVYITQQPNQTQPY